MLRTRAALASAFLVALAAAPAAGAFPVGVGAAPCNAAACSVFVAASEWFYAVVHATGAHGIYRIDGPGESDVTCSAPAPCAYSTNAPGPFTVTASRIGGSSGFYFDWLYAV